MGTFRCSRTGSPHEACHGRISVECAVAATGRGAAEGGVHRPRRAMLADPALALSSAACACGLPLAEVDPIHRPCRPAGHRFVATRATASRSLASGSRRGPPAIYDCTPASPASVLPNDVPHYRSCACDPATNDFDTRLAQLYATRRRHHVIERWARCTRPLLPRSFARLAVKASCVPRGQALTESLPPLRVVLIRARSARARRFCLPAPDRASALSTRSGQERPRRAQPLLVG